MPLQSLKSVRQQLHSKALPMLAAWLRGLTLNTAKEHGEVGVRLLLA